MMTETYFRVIGSGVSGAVQATPGAAWDSFHRAARRQHGYDDSDEGTAVAAHSARLIEATTRRAAADADVSASHGRVGKGEWWMSA